MSDSRNHHPQPETAALKVHLVDGTYELFRHYFALPAARNEQGEEIGAVRGVVRSLLAMVEDGATHLAVATDHVVDSFRNEMWPGYKDGSSIEPELLGQFPVLETALEAAGFAVWPMVEFEADDGLASGAALAARDSRVDRIFICTPDKDLAQCVRDDRVVQFDRRRRVVLNREGIIEKFGVPPESIPDYLALVGDSSDGYPGLKGWGARSASRVLARYGHLEMIPRSADRWEVRVRGAPSLAAVFNEHFDDALLFREIATVRTDAPVAASVEELLWRPPGDGGALAARILADNTLESRLAAIGTA